ncbi:MAG: glycosyltransferase family 4 protein [Phocaeicola sp.]
MKILLINTSDRTGGAAIAASRLLASLKGSGVRVQLLVRNKQGDEPRVIALRKSWWHVWQFMWERMVIWCANRFKKQNLFAVSIANTGNDITQLPEFKQASVIHLHWINQGMLSLREIERILQAGKPVVWTMHDMWPFTAICHYAGECTHYQQHCHSCPELYKGSSSDLSFRTFKVKQEVWKKAPITFVGCSNWLAQQASTATLTKGHWVTNIPNPINTALFKPLNKELCRKKKGLPPHKKLLLFGSMKVSDKRKGMDYLIEACKELVSRTPQVAESWGVVVFGQAAQHYSSLFPFSLYPLDYIHSESELVELYNAVDLYVTPSLQDNLPNTIMEAMACGTPCVGFEVGGIPEMIDHLHNGYVAQYKSTLDLSNGISWVLQEANYELLCESARRKVIDCYAEEVVAKQYIELYNKLTRES